MARLLAVSPYEYRDKPHGGTRASSQALGVDEHAVVKTLVMEDESRTPLIILMHGDREVSTRQLARQAGRSAGRRGAVARLAERISGR